MSKKYRQEKWLSRLGAFWAALFFFLSPSLSHGDVYKFPDRDIHLSLGFGSLDYAMLLDDDGTDQSLEYEPNLGGLIIPRLAYKDIFALSWAFDVPVTQEEKLLYGETRYTDVRFEFSFQKWTIHSFYSQYRGFSLIDSVSSNSMGGGGGQRVLRPDLYSRGFGASVTWVLDEDRFSLPNLLAQNHRQESDGGSWLFGASLRSHRISADFSLVPDDVEENYDVLRGFRGGHFQTLATKVGYGYAYATKWFFGFAGQVGPGLARKNLEFTDGSRGRGWEPSLRAEVLLSGGYNGDIFFVGLKADVHQEFIFLSNSSSQIISRQATGLLNFGLHLDALNY